MAKNLFIIKADGRKVPFNEKKIISTCRRAGAGKDATKRIVKKIRGQIFPGIKTKDIFKMVLRALGEEKGGTVLKQKYQLKDAIMRLGPGGFIFEIYVGQILKHSNFKVKNIGAKIRGKCALHEIDVIAISEDKKFMIECKYHSSHGIYTGLKESMYTHARFLDLTPRFQKEVLTCNTKVSFQAKKYAKCVGQQILSWRYPPGNSLEKIIEKNRLYPITILNLNTKEIAIFSKNHIMLAKDLLNYTEFELAKITGIKAQRIKNFQKLVRQLFDSP